MRGIKKKMIEKDENDINTYRYKYRFKSCIFLSKIIKFQLSFFKSTVLLIFK